jgi:hypothetical protein
MRTSWIALLLAVAPAFRAVAQPSRPVVAILESPECVEGSPAWRVHPLFGLAAGGWVALNTAEASRPFDLRDVTWTVAFDGRNLGSVRSIDPGFSTKYAWTYSRDRRLTVQPVPRPPVVANAKGAFDGWCAPKTRPVVLVTPTNFEDPDRWKPFSPTAAMRDRLFPEFKRAVGQVNHCPADAEKYLSFAYAAANIAVVKGYRDRTGRMLVALQLDGKRYGCDGPAGPEWSLQWFLLSNGIRSLGANLELVDAGDYDGDGKSEVLFWFSGYNKDGFTLFYDDLAKRADFRWSYH